MSGNPAHGAVVGPADAVLGVGDDGPGRPGLIIRNQVAVLWQSERLERLGRVEAGRWAAVDAGELGRHVDEAGGYVNLEGADLTGLLGAAGAGVALPQSLFAVDPLVDCRHHAGEGFEE